MPQKIETVETIDDALKVISDLNEKLANAEKKLTQVNQQESEKLIAEVTATKEQLQVEKKQKEISESKLEEVEANLTKLNEEIESLKKSLAEKDAELELVASRERLANRLSQMSEKNIKVEDSEKDEIAKMSDESFASILKYAERVSPIEDTPKAEETAPEVETPVEESNKADESAEADLASAEAEVENVAAEDLDKSVDNKVSPVELMSKAIASVRASRNKRNKSVSK